MLEELALSLSTAIFFICTVMVSAVIPSSPSETSSICETVTESPDTAVSVISSTQNDLFSLVGVWNNSGRSFEFTKQGELLFDNNTADYSFDGENVTIKALIDGVERSYTFKLEILSPRVVKIGGVVFYKIGQAVS